MAAQKPEFTPPVAREGFTQQLMDGYPIDLTTVDWDATDDAINLRNKFPRALWSNVEGLISIIPAGSPPNQVAFKVYVRPGPIPWVVRKIDRANCDVAFRNATSLVAGF